MEEKWWEVTFFVFEFLWITRISNIEADVWTIHQWTLCCKCQISYFTFIERFASSSLLGFLKFERNIWDVVKNENSNSVKSGLGVWDSIFLKSSWVMSFLLVRKLHFGNEDMDGFQNLGIQFVSDFMMGELPFLNFILPDLLRILCRLVRIE